MAGSTSKTTPTSTPEPTAMGKVVEVVAVPSVTVMRMVAVPVKPAGGA